jgi:SpoVK/Ycf46/Vps4 family AAA+-type ATPase
MLNNKKRRPFKSYTDINNYNKFLIELDNKQKNKNNDDNTISYTHVGSEFNSNDGLFQNLNNPVSLDDTNIIPIFRTNPSVFVYPDGSPIKPYIPVSIEKTKINIETKIECIGDLLSIIDKYSVDKNIQYNINIETLHKIRTPLTNLNNMIGMKELKENIVDQLLFYIQNLHNPKSNDFMHTVIYGSPGTGKTEVAKIIGQLFSNMGILSKGTFKKVTRADLVAGYLGQTAIKTRDVIKECLGGVLFIDEAYALGNEEKRDSFSKECIDTLCESLSDHKDNLMVIVAGYESDLNNCFFNYNQGLNSRFTWRFKIDEYSAEDLYNIFIKKVKDNNWNLAITENNNININWFEKNKKHFKFYGRDIETLFAKTKIAHSRRVFGLDESVKKLITITDLNKGFEMYLKNENSQSKQLEKMNTIISSMYC